MNAPKEAYPLSWPERWPKPPHRWSSQFGDRSIAAARDEVMRQLGMLGARGVIISSNLRLRQDGLPMGGQAQPADPSVAVYFTLKEKPHVLACGKWNRVQDNLWAIAKDIEATRGKARWGVGTVEQAFRGYQALPETSSGSAWWAVLGVTINATPDQVRDAFRAKAKLYHPDSGTEPNHEKMVEVNRAYEQATQQKGAV